MTRSNIEWTESTWNPVVGCTRVSDACDHCYAVTMSHRLASMAQLDIEAGADPGRKADYIGLTVLNPKGDRHFNGQVRCVPERLDEPLRWRAPRMVFTASMSDIFHPSVPFEFLFRMLGVMALTPHHTYQVLTKRPERAVECLTMKDVHREIEAAVLAWHAAQAQTDYRLSNALPVHPLKVAEHLRVAGLPDRWCWPLPNVWLGTTVEDQARADERIPHLLRCPAAVRFVSCEPLLGEIDLWGDDGDWMLPCPLPNDEAESDEEFAARPWINRHSLGSTRCSLCDGPGGPIGWVITGGETAPANKARPTDDAWLRSLRDQCRAAGVPFFLKQRTERGRKIPIEQWPDDLRVREWPDNRPDSGVAASHEGRRAEARGG